MIEAILYLGQCYRALTSKQEIIIILTIYHLLAWNDDARAPLQQWDCGLVGPICSHGVGGFGGCLIGKETQAYGEHNLYSHYTSNWLFFRILQSYVLLLLPAHPLL